MRTIDADKFLERLNQIKQDIDRKQSAMDNNPFLSIYHSAIGSTMSAIIIAANDSAVD